MKPLPYILLLALLVCGFKQVEIKSSIKVATLPHVIAFSIPDGHSDYIWAFQSSTNLVDWSYCEMRPDDTELPVFHYEPDYPVLPRQNGDVCFYRVEWSRW